MASRIDLNLLPGLPPSSSSTAPTLIPKVEPKLEHFEEPTTLPASVLLTSPSNGHFPNSHPSPSSGNPNSGVSHPGEDNGYSELSRISKLFRHACAGEHPGTSQLVANVMLDPNSLAVVPLPGAVQPRSSDLVRFACTGTQEWGHIREAVRRTRMLYDSLRIFFIVEEQKEKGIGVGRRRRVDMKAASTLRNCELWLNRDKRIVGSIPGIRIGDLFFYRMELCVVGLHGQTQAGIDYLTASQSSNGQPIAISVIVSGGYEDDEDAGDVITYTGQGGQDKFGRQYAHQKLEAGNLALERSMHYGIELRVIRGFKYEGSITGKVYVYDGLYRITNCWFDMGKSGFGVYKYKLLRFKGQPEMGSSILRFAQSLRTVPLSMRPTGYISLDMSMKKEKVPVFLFNDIDNDREPMLYEYLVKIVAPPYAYHNGGNGSGCECVSGCSYDCFCTMKNGGELPYDQNGILLRGKPLIFECGSFCRCPPDCRNRVSQNGVRNRLEVFRSRETSWGVRSLDLIPAGAFICEYAGVVLTRDQASVFTMNGDTLIYPNQFTNRWTEWGDLSRVYSNYVRPSCPLIPPLDFALDVSHLRNVACYISQSSSPNVLVQLVMYDHDNISFPHLMLFALENIPPLKDLSLDYGRGRRMAGVASCQ